MDQSAPDVATEPNDPAADAARFLHDLLQRRPIVSWTIAGFCTVYFGLQLLWGRGDLLLPAIAMGAEVPVRVFAGEWWRVLSVMLLHGSFEHLALNMLALLSFGPFLERMIGSARYLVLYVLSGVGGSLLSLQRGDDGIGVGASGGIWGLMVAGAVLVTWPRGLLPQVLAVHWQRRAWTPVAINLAYSFMPGIDYRAHLGGGLVGGLLLFLLLRSPRMSIPMPARRSASLAAVGTGALLVLAVAMALVAGQPWRLFGAWQLAPVALQGTSFSLQVPTAFAGGPTGEGSWKWGDLNANGAEILVELAPPLDAGADEQQVLTDLLAELRQQKPKGMQQVVIPVLRKLGSGREVACTSYVPENQDDTRRLSMWWQIEGHRPVLVIGNVITAMAEAREAELTQIVDSLRSDGRPR